MVFRQARAGRCRARKGCRRSECAAYRRGHAAAAEQRRLDRLARAKAQNEAECLAFNEPLSLAIGYADQALHQLRRIRDAEQIKVEALQRDRHPIQAAPGKLLAKEQLPILIDRAKDAESAAAIRAAMVAALPFDTGAYATALEWLTPINAKLEEMETSIERMREHIIHPHLDEPSSLGLGELATE